MILRRRKAAPWVAAAIAMLVLPRLLPSGLGLLLYAECAIMIVLALSYNLLLGTTGMLSFGHAVYSGIGAYATIHALNWIGASHLPLPVTLLPLLGGFGGLVGGATLGFVSTRRSGTPFAMITLGISELVGACWLMFPSVFGGEGGVPGNRTVGVPFLGVEGWNLASDRQVDLLLGVWCLVAVVGMRALLATPLGRIANAVRDNAERAEFVGYSARQVRWLMLMASSFFAGIAGGMAALNFEIVTAENVGAVRSGEMLLAAYIGGVGTFHGPILGAITYMFFAVALSQFTSAWPLYLGIFFVGLVLLAPGGIADLLARAQRRLREGTLRAQFATLAPRALAALAGLAGSIVAIEATYQHQVDPTGESPVRVFWTSFAPGRPGIWLLAAFLGSASALLFAWIRRRDAEQARAEQA